MRHARAVLLALLAPAALALAIVAALPGGREAPADRLAGWTAATWRARKFLVASASTTVERAPAPRWCFPSWWTGPRDAPVRVVRVTMEARLFGSGRGERTAWSLVGRAGGEDAGGSRGFLVVVPGRKARAVVPGGDGSWWVRTWRADDAGRWKRPRDRRLPGEAPPPGTPDAWSVLADPLPLLAAAGGEVALLTRRGVVRARVRELGRVRRRLALVDEDTGGRFAVTVAARRVALEPATEGAATLFDLVGPTVVEVDPRSGLLLLVEGRAEKLGRVRVRLAGISRRPRVAGAPRWPPAAPVDAAPGNP